MHPANSPRRVGRRMKVFITLAIVITTLAVLLYFEQLAIIYIGSTMALIVLLILVAFSDLETIGVNATEEAYMTRRSDGVFEAGLSTEPAAASREPLKRGSE